MLLHRTALNVFNIHQIFTVLRLAAPRSWCWVLVMRDLPNRPHHRWRSCSPPVILFKSNCQRISAQQIFENDWLKEYWPHCRCHQHQGQTQEEILWTTKIEKTKTKTTQKMSHTKNKMIKYECANSIFSIPESPSPCPSPQASPGRFWTWKNNFKKRHFDNSLIMSSTQLIPWGFLTFDVCLVLLKVGWLW